MLTTALFLFAALLSAVLLFTMVFYIIMFSDLKMDYVNPIELCKRLNFLTVPEMACHAALTALFLVSLQFVALLWNVPLVIYNFNKLSERKHRMEPTDIFRELPDRKREALIKLGFFLVSFFYYLYRMVHTLI